jgi:hypothetical protein
LRIGVTRKIDIANPETGALEQRIKRAEDLVCDMLEDEEPFHSNKYSGSLEAIEISRTLCRTDAAGGASSFRMIGIYFSLNFQ